MPAVKATCVRGVSCTFCRHQKTRMRRDQETSLEGSGVATHSSQGLPNAQAKNVLLANNRPFGSVLDAVAGHLDVSPGNRDHAVLIDQAEDASSLVLSADHDEHWLRRVGSRTFVNQLLQDGLCEPSRKDDCDWSSRHVEDMREQVWSRE